MHVQRNSSSNIRSFRMKENNCSLKRRFLLIIDKYNTEYHRNTS